MWLLSARCDRFDLADDIGESFLGLGDNLDGDLSPMDFDIPREIECDAHPFAFDRGNTDDADRILWISDHHFFTFSTRDDEHIAPQTKLTNGLHTGASISTPTSVASKIGEPEAQTRDFTHTCSGGLYQKIARLVAGVGFGLRGWGQNPAPKANDPPLIHSLNTGHLGDMLAEVSLNSHLEGDFERRAPDAGTEEPDLDDSGVGDAYELDVAAVGLDRGADELDHAGDLIVEALGAGFG